MVQTQSEISGTKKYFFNWLQHVFLMFGEDHEPEILCLISLGNGASLERINWLGDISKTGIEQSAGNGKLPL